MRVTRSRTAGEGGVDSRSATARSEARTRASVARTDRPRARTRAVLADPLREVLLGEAARGEEPLQGLGRLHRVQVLALQVLDERELERVVVGGLADEDRDLLKPRALGGAPAALAGDDLEAAAREAPGEDGLEDPLLADRLRELLELGLLEHLARLAVLRVQILDRAGGDAARRGRRGRRLRTGDEGLEAATQRLATIHVDHASRSSRARSR
jgi:hypothetical protein